jgi:hypothetical protein
VLRRRPINWGIVVLLAVIGTAAGVALTFAAGSVCSDGVSESFCGLNFLVWNFSSEAAIAASGALGAVAGALFGFILDSGLARRRSAG